MLHQTTKVAIARQVVKDDPRLQLCKGGSFLCQEAERLWRRSCALYGTPEYAQARFDYDAHEPHYHKLLTHQSLPL